MTDELPPACDSTQADPIANLTRSCRKQAGHDGSHGDAPTEWANAGTAARCLVSYCASPATFHCIYPNGHDGRHGDGESHRWDRNGHFSIVPEAPCVQVCGDVFAPDEAGSPPCPLPAGHGSYHRSGRYCWPDDHRWISDSSPLPTAGATVTGRCNHKPGVVIDGEEIDCCLPGGHDGGHESNCGFSDSACWPNRIGRDIGSGCDARERRDRATELAIRALRGAAGAYIESVGTGKYGSAIIALAEQLGGYVRDGRARG